LKPPSRKKTVSGWKLLQVSDGSLDAIQPLGDIFHAGGIGKSGEFVSSECNSGDKSHLGMLQEVAAKSDELLMVMPL